MHREVGQQMIYQYICRSKTLQQSLFLKTLNAASTRASCIKVQASCRYPCKASRASLHPSIAPRHKFYVVYLFVKESSILTSEIHDHDECTTNRESGQELPFGSAPRSGNGTSLWINNKSTAQIRAVWLHTSQSSRILQVRGAE